MKNHGTLGLQGLKHWNKSLFYDVIPIYELPKEKKIAIRSNQWSWSSEKKKKRGTVSGWLFKGNQY